MKYVEEIKQEFKLLLENPVNGFSQDDKMLINSAIYSARGSIGGVKWGESDEPLLLHLLKICLVLRSEIGLSKSSIIATILYIPYCNSVISEEYIREHYGDSVASIVRCLYEIKELKLKNETYETEAVRNLLLKKSRDIRSFFVYLAWHLHEIRTSDLFSPYKQKEIAYKSMLFIPICHRIGLFKIKAEFEEYYMQTTHPEAYKSIRQQIQITEKEQEEVIREFVSPIEKQLKEDGYDFEIKSRIKSVPSIWNKMKRMNFTSLTEVYDLFAVRIVLNNVVTDEKTDCWHTYSIVEAYYTPIQDRLRDWITHPKKSGYEALHTTVKTKSGLIVEVQIRTKRMHDNAELGSAAHWKYKESNYKNSGEEWLRNIREMMEGNDGHYSKMDMFPNDIFVITPTGDVRQLTKGATVLDFAFMIHTSLGLTCTSAKVNDKLVPIRHILENGDRVEIITSKRQKPSPDWLNFVATNRAANRIKIALDQEKTLQAKAGHDILDRKFKNWKMKLTSDGTALLMKHYKFKLEKDLFAAIYNEVVDMLDVKKLIAENTQQLALHNPTPLEVLTTDKDKDRGKSTKSDIVFLDRATDNIDYHFAKCCTPILGDKVFGFITVDRGIVIHRYSCPNAAELLSRYGYRVIDAEWTSKGVDAPFQVSLHINANDRKGIIDDISAIIKDDMKINIESLSLTNQKDKISATYVVYVNDTKQLGFLIHKLEKLNGITNVKREINE